MKPLWDFLKGMGMRPVDYTTRHYSKSYEAGVNAGCILFFATPFALAFGLGVAVGVCL